MFITEVPTEGYKEQVTGCSLRGVMATGQFSILEGVARSIKIVSAKWSCREPHRILKIRGLRVRVNNSVRHTELYNISSIIATHDACGTSWIGSGEEPCPSLTTVNVSLIMTQGLINS